MTMIANAQATKASDDAFAGAMIRNVLIIGGIVVVFYVIKSFNKKND